MARLTTTSGRILREGDEVRVLRGSRVGKTGTVVGFDLLSENPVVVQFPKVARALLREGKKSGDLELNRAQEAPESLEPLPSIQKVLQEGGVAPVFMTCGIMLCLTLTEDGTVLTFVPRTNGVSLRRLFEAKYRKSLTEAVRDVLQHSFVTRLPHLVQIGKSKVYGTYLSAPVSPEVKVGMLLGSSLNS